MAAAKARRAAPLTATLPAAPVLGGVPVELGFAVGEAVGWMGAPVEPVGVDEAVALWPWPAEPEGTAVP